LFIGEVGELGRFQVEISQKRRHLREAQTPTTKSRQGQTSGTL
jgi:hypothetical protein